MATLSSLPDEVVDTVGTVLPSEDSVSERRRKLEFLEMQEELIKVLHGFCIVEVLFIFTHSNIVVFFALSLRIKILIGGREKARERRKSKTQGT